MQRNSSRSPIVCPVCQLPFIPPRAKSIYCSYSCSGHANASKAPIKPIEDRFWEKVQKSEHGCWVWTGSKSSFGYGKLGTGRRINGASHSFHTHRYSWELHFGPIPAGLYVCHKCDNRPCVRPDHLFLGTAKENSVDAANKGRMGQQPKKKGVDHWHAKITEQDVLAIRQRAATEPRQDLAAEYGLSVTSIYDIVRGRSWKHLPVRLDADA